MRSNYTYTTIANKSRVHSLTRKKTRVNDGNNNEMYPEDIELVCDGCGKWAGLYWWLQSLNSSTGHFLVMQSLTIFIQFSYKWKQVYMLNNHCNKNTLQIGLM